MKLGSLFDGSGGFPLAGTICGMQPVWASEIEPYPLRVTEARFPNMKQLGDVTKIDGTAIEPVEVITFGSPCQDLSVAGKQAGIHEGERSNLFFEAIRIIKEMREHDRCTGRADEHLRPRFAVWENVPGAFSSNKGADFQAVLQALCEIADTSVSVPLPEKGKWQKSGCIVGDGYSIAWRVYDAQFWGVPQRRKRIYLVADFGSERAGEILFEREGVCWDTAQSREAWEGTAADAEGSVGRSRENWGVTYGVDCRNTAVDCEKTHTLQAKAGGGFSLNYTPSVLYPNMCCCQNTGQGWWNQGEIAQTLRTPCGGDATKANLVVYDTTQITSPMNYSNPKPGDPCHPLAAQQHPPLAVYDMQRIGQYGESGKASSLKARDYKDATDLVCYDMTHANDVIRECNNVTPTLQHRMGTGGNQVPIKVDIGKPPRKYIVRRLTPLECCRLQGFPDWWEDGVEGSDSARYKMWGNGIALPCAVDVLGGIATHYEMEGNVT